MADADEEIVEDSCANCGERVVLVEYIKGVQWMHQPEDVKDREDMMHLHCKLTVAESRLLATATEEPAPTRLRATAGQRVSSSREQNVETWWWECDHAHDTSAGEVPWCGTALTQDAAYTELDQHNATHHPHLTEEARRG